MYNVKIVNTEYPLKIVTNEYPLYYKLKATKDFTLKLKKHVCDYDDIRPFSEYNRPDNIYNIDVSKYKKIKVFKGDESGPIHISSIIKGPVWTSSNVIIGPNCEVKGHSFITSQSNNPIEISLSTIDNSLIVGANITGCKIQNSVLYNTNSAQSDIIDVVATDIIDSYIIDYIDNFNIRRKYKNPYIKDTQISRSILYLFNSIINTSIIVDSCGEFNKWNIEEEVLFDHMVSGMINSNELKRYTMNNLDIVKKFSICKNQ